MSTANMQVINISDRTNTATWRGNLLLVLRVATGLGEKSIRLVLLVPVLFVCRCVFFLVLLGECIFLVWTLGAQRSRTISFAVTYVSESIAASPCL